MNAQAPQQKPTLWQRGKNAVKNFVGHALGYIPRGIIFTGIAFGASAALGSVGWDLLGINQAVEAGNLLPRFLAHLAVGGVLSGVIGASVTPCPVCESQHSQPHAGGNPLISKKEAELGHYMAKAVTDHGMDVVATGSGLPTPAVPLIKNALNATLGK